MSEDCATKSDDYSDWEFDIKNTARVQIINVYDNLAAIPNDSYESIKITFNVTGLGGGAAEDTASDATDAGSAATPEKGSPDTGVEGVAAIAGLAVIAGGAVAISRKRK